MPEIQTYEVVYWLVPDENAAREGREVLARKIRDFGGEVINDPEPVIRRIGYAIEKQREGYFGILTAKMPVETPQKLHNELAHDAKILRLTFVKAGPAREIRRGRTAGVRPDEKGSSLREFDQRLEEILHESR